MGAYCSSRRQVKGGTKPEEDSETLSDDIRDLYVIGPVLGSGAFGEVRDCTMRKPKRTDVDLIRAVKIMENKDTDRGDWSNSAMFRREIAVLSKLDHAYIIKYHDFFEDEHFLYAVMEKCDGGELFDQICKRRRFTEEDAAVLCRQILSALEYIHNLGVVHRDVKAENFLFKDKSANSPIKMIDFGMSAKITEGQKLNEVCGSPHYLAPELLRKNYDSQADMWALGVLIYLMLYGKYPFDGKETKEIVREIIHKKVDSLFERQKFIYSAHATDFIHKLLNRDPVTRLTAKQALLHPWVAHLRTYAEQKEEELRKIKAAEETQQETIMLAVRSAQRKVTLARQTRPKVAATMSAERRAQLLAKLDTEYNEGHKHSLRITGDGLRTNKANTRGELEVDGRADYRARPEYSRHDKRISTTPSRLQGHDALALELALLQVTMEDSEEAQRLIEEGRHRLESDNTNTEAFFAGCDDPSVFVPGSAAQHSINNPHQQHGISISLNIAKRGEALPTSPPQQQQQLLTNDYNDKTGNSHGAAGGAPTFNVGSPFASPFNNNVHLGNNVQFNMGINPNASAFPEGDLTLSSPLVANSTNNPGSSLGLISPRGSVMTPISNGGNAGMTTRKSKRAFTTHVIGSNDSLDNMNGDNNNNL